MSCTDKMYLTGSEICSDNPRDLSDNARVFDAYVNSEEDTVKDRFGTPRLTLAGIEKNVDERISGVIQEAGGVEVVGEFGDSDSKVLNQDITSRYLTYSSKQNKLFSNFMEKLKIEGGATINCVGTSNTSNNWGQNGYPYHLGLFLGDVYGREVSINNLGVSGTTVEKQFNRWKDKTPRADFTIMEWTGNDQRVTPIQKFIADVERYVEFEIDSGRAVMIITSPKTTHSDNYKRDIYMSSLYLIAKRYGIYSIDNELNLKNCENEMYHDYIHLNEVGNKYMAHRIAATLFGETISNPKIVSSGTSLLTRPTIDSIVYGDNAEVSKSKIKLTPAELWEWDLGIVASLRGGSSDASVFYSFYANVDNLWIVPVIRVDSGAKITIEIDGGGAAPVTSINPSANTSQSWEYNKKGRYEFIAKDKEILNTSDFMYFDPIPLIVEGWHSIKITASGGTVLLYGLEFYGLQELKKLITKEVVGTHVVSNKIDIHETTIPMTEINRISHDEINKYLPYRNGLYYFTWLSADYSYIAMVKTTAEAKGGWRVMKTDYIEGDQGGTGRSIKSIRQVGSDLKIEWNGDLKQHGNISIRR